MLLFFACTEEKADTVVPIEQEVNEPDESCHEAILDWSDSWNGIEMSTLAEINLRRAEVADCRTGGVFQPAPTLEVDPYLHCSSRYHSYWMGQNNVLQHESPGGDLGEDTWQRMSNAGFTGFGTGENVAVGFVGPSDLVEGWMNSDAHCSIIMDPNATVAGVGYYYVQSGYMHYWTLNTGRY